MCTEKKFQSQDLVTPPLGSCSTRIHWDSYDMGLWDGLKVFSKIAVVFLKNEKRRYTLFEERLFFQGGIFSCAAAGKKTDNTSGVLRALFSGMVASEPVRTS